MPVNPNVCGDHRKDGHQSLYPFSFSGLSPCATCHEGMKTYAMTRIQQYFTQLMKSRHAPCSTAGICGQYAIYVGGWSSLWIIPGCFCENCAPARYAGTPVRNLLARRGMNEFLPGNRVLFQGSITDAGRIYWPTIWAGIPALITALYNTRYPWKKIEL